MLPGIDNQDIFHFNTGSFQLVETGEPPTPFFENTRTGGRIQADETGKALISILPASFPAISREMNQKKQYVSDQMLKYYLLLFWKAGILEKEPQGLDTSAVLSSPGTGELKKNPARDERVSVVIVSYNGEKFLRANLETLSRQTLTPREIIIVDNASTDGSLSIVAKEFPHVTITRNKRNYHYAHAVNIGVGLASGELVIILNQDIEVEPGFIQSLVQRYDDEKDKENIAGVVPQMRFSKLRQCINGIGNFVTEKDWGSDNYFCVVDVGQFDHLTYVSSACFGAIMVTRQGWNKVGPLDRKYKSFYEDSDWSIRAHMAGMKLCAAPRAIVYHAFGGSYPSGLKLTFIAKNRLRFVFKNLKGKLLKTFFKKYLKHDIKSALAFIRRRQYINIYYYMKAYIRLLLELPGIWFYRRRLHKTPENNICSFFTKGAPYVILSNRQHEPVINKHSIRCYYLFTEVEAFQFPTELIKV